MSFQVDTAALGDAATQIGTLADAIPSALSYAEQHVTAPGGGQVIDSIITEIERARGDLQAVYAPGGPFQSYLRGASDALAANATDYAATDAASRAGFDALLPGAGAPAEPGWGLDADGETAGVAVTDLTATLVPPSGFFEGLDTWRAILDNVSYACSFLWVFDALTQMPFFYELPKPTQDLRDTFDGDWEAVGNVSLALDALEDFHGRLAAELAATGLALQSTWDGNAADAAYSSFAAFTAVVDEHCGNLSSTSQGLHGFAVGMRFLTDALCGALDTLVGLVLELLKFDPWDLIDWFARGGSQALRWITVISKAIDLIILCIDLVFALVAVFPLTLGQINRYPGLAVPHGDATTFTPSDVDGP
ncbi:WXG100 family type VII secretion target [Nocardioides sp. CPCC 205120]|uniref:WXG100 family type VII secretion target n=1 Tax=Nocardioides sp. CPCC 205120 TaxID=3406462 RepID=UPI003B5036CC